MSNFLCYRYTRKNITKEERICIKHLFLQGNISIGKSTLIQKALLKNIKHVAGYFVQRIFVDDEYKGFSIHPVEEEEYILNKKVEHISQAKHLFLYETDAGKWEFNNKLFENIVLYSLGNRKEKKIILMDELGGMEIKWPKFMNKILKVFDEDIPIIGVLKTPKGMEKMHQKLKLEENENEYYQKICKHPKVHIVDVNDENLLDIEKTITDYVRRSFSSAELDR